MISLAIVMIHVQSLKLLVMLYWTQALLLLVSLVIRLEPQRFGPLLGLLMLTLIWLLLFKQI
jgi:hypothetical protein